MQIFYPIIEFLQTLNVVLWITNFMKNIEAKKEADNLYGLD